MVPLGTGANVRTCLALFGALASLQCQSASRVLAPLPAGGTHVLFIGNSLTYVNDLPSTVAALALASGDTIRVAQVAFADYALVDHVADGTAIKAIRLGGWHYVVLQQGPSSVQVNRDSLILMTQYFDTYIRSSGARTALFSVWPAIGNYSTFPRAIESYQLAAAAVNGVYLPVGAAWLAAWAKDSTLQLYSSDGLHPSELGTYLAALVMYERFTGKDAREMPAQAVVAGTTLAGVPAATVRLLQAAAHETNAQAATR
jgi:hypothetical protein